MNSCVDQGNEEEGEEVSTVARCCQQDGGSPAAGDASMHSDLASSCGDLGKEGNRGVDVNDLETGSPCLDAEEAVTEAEYDVCKAQEE